MLLRRFDLPIFKPWPTSEQKAFPENKILPFISNELKNDTSGFGKVYRFKIHPDYNHIFGDDNTPVPEFARKVLRADNQNDFEVECDNLAFVYSLGNPNIIKMLSWYTAEKPEKEKEYAYVFPFVDTNLQDILRGLDSWKHKEDASLFESTVWKQMEDTTKALVDIHNPQEGLKTGNWVGYHLDLKPSNILVDKNGKFLIADFGNSVFHSRGGNEAAAKSTVLSQKYMPRAGTPEYSPPDIEISSEWEDLPKFRRGYDVWSLACIMTEVITFIVGYDAKKRHTAVKAFTNLRSIGAKDDRSTAWYYKIGGLDNKLTFRLKPSVDDWFKNMTDLAGEGNLSYLQDVLSILRDMFKIEDRPSSKEVFKKLEIARREEKDRRSSIPGEKAKFSINRWIQARGYGDPIYDSQKSAPNGVFLRDY
ncbi:hypothetical protein ABW20_dc0105074 [Dactylellina cionopaga]|nr:hypothetical protein ABW20_dc0105074 [Dactylellina cionopaga]